MFLFGGVENQKWTADWHFLHKNMLRYCNRPFKDTNHMHKSIIENFNDVLTENSHLWILGDVSMTSTSNMNKVAALISKIKGHKHLVLGNHDEARPYTYINHVGFTTVHTSMWFQHEKLNFFMAHDPAVYNVVESTGSIMLCGHVHLLFKHLFPHKKVINVGVDAWDFKPVGIEQVLEIVNDNA